MFRHDLYIQIADAVRARSGGEDIIDAVHAVACEAVETAEARCRDEFLHTKELRSRVPAWTCTPDQLDLFND